MSEQTEEELVSVEQRLGSAHDGVGGLMELLTLLIRRDDRRDPGYWQGELQTRERLLESTEVDHEKHAFKTQVAVLKAALRDS